MSCLNVFRTVLMSARVMLLSSVKKLRKDVSPKQLADIDNRRVTLTKHIDEFLAKTPYGYDFDDDTRGHHLQRDKWSTEGDDGEVNDEFGDEAPETTVLPLPSSFKPNERATRGITPYMVTTELQIRLGQADETLHEIRTIVGHKSFVFRKELRQSRGQKSST